MRNATAHQQSPAASPKVTVTVGNDVYTSEGAGGDERIVSVKTDEQAYGGQYVIELDNSDEALNTKDYKGSEVTLNLSFIGETADNYPPLWFHNQQFISKEGKLLLQLNCVDKWGFLAQYKTDLAKASYNMEWQKEEVIDKMTLPSGEPIPENLKEAITNNYGKTIWQIIFDITSSLGITVSLDDDDGIINDRQPPINISNARSGIIQLLGMTKSYMKWTAGGIFRIIQPDIHSTAYSFNTANLFFSNLEDVAVTIPNRVIFWSFNEDGTEWISGQANDTASQSKVGIIPVNYLLGNMQVDARASEETLTALAEGALAKIQGERSLGTLVAPMHVSLELFDKISVTDSRYGTPKTTTGYVHRIVREYDRGVYRITIQLGGVTSGYTPPGGGLPTPLAEAEPPKAPSTTFWDSVLPKAIQGFQHDITFSAVDWDTVNWTAGTVKFYDGTTQSIDSGSINLPDGVIRYIYFDLASSPTVLKATTNYLNVMTMNTGVVCVVQRGSDTGVAATVIPSFGKTPLITADVIYLTGLLDRLPNGTYGKVLATHLSAGKILLQSSTVKSGSWYAESGVIIDATTGIEIQGNADLKFTKNGDYPCYIYTGTYGDLVFLPYTDRWIWNLGHICVSGDKKFGLLAASEESYLYWHTGGSYDHNFAPDTNNFGRVGTSTKKWYRMYAGAFLTSSPKPVADALTKIKAVRQLSDGSYDKTSLPIPVYVPASVEDEQAEKASIIKAAKEEKKKIEALLANPEVLSKLNSADKLYMEQRAASVLDEAKSKADAVKSEPSIDIGAMASFALSAVKELLERVEALEARQCGGNYVKH